ncbi:hypothetical protein EPR50_G00163070 [Perca flavescens]|uniref:Uncharacterized protein n=1 Tax=Perca flavescens TaxID=8167 RepID=A0A484CNZ2_PERFV|nr:hypothetical protein EPR50_G00163070 [Perca flavescens]
MHELLDSRPLNQTMVSTGSLEPQQVLFCREGKSSSVPLSQKGNLEVLCIKEEPTSVYVENLVKIFCHGKKLALL